MYHIFNLRYSQTDNRNLVIVRAATKEQAEKKLLDNARYREYYGCTERII